MSNMGNWSTSSWMALGFMPLLFAFSDYASVVTKRNSLKILMQFPFELECGGACVRGKTHAHMTCKLDRKLVEHSTVRS
jgi:hypothetical protein